MLAWVVFPASREAIVGFLTDMLKQAAQFDAKAGPGAVRTPTTALGLKPAARVVNQQGGKGAVVPTGSGTTPALQGKLPMSPKPPMGGAKPPVPSVLLKQPKKLAKPKAKNFFRPPA